VVSAGNLAGARARPGRGRRQAHRATYEHALDGSYPLTRFLYIYVNQPPDQPLDKLTGEFIRFVLSHEGQEIVVQAKFFPLPAKIVSDTLSGKN